MGAVTYPHSGVERRLKDSFVVFRPHIEQEAALAKKFLVSWTPGFLFLDGLENIHHRAYGYHPPEEFEHLLHVGHGMIEFNRENYKGALAIFAQAAEDAERSAVQPQALYWFGVCQYKTGDKEGMKRSWSILLDTYPKNIWALKASIVRPKAQAA